MVYYDLAQWFLQVKETIVSDNMHIGNLAIIIWWKAIESVIAINNITMHWHL